MYWLDHTGNKCVRKHVFVNENRDKYATGSPAVQSNSTTLDTCTNRNNDGVKITSDKVELHVIQLPKIRVPTEIMMV